MRRTRIWAAITIAIAMTTLVGCGAASAAADGYWEPQVRSVFEQPLPDGRTVLCVYAGQNKSSGGLSCDWDGAE